jgi:hypothetical protein
MKKLTLIVSFLFVFAAFTFSQDFGADAQRVEMKKLEPSVGKWEGTGWIQMGPNKQYFQGTETIQKKLDGLALLVEGRFTDKAKPDAVIHQTLAVLNFDPREKSYKFKTYLVNGVSGMHNAKLIDGGWEWGFEIPNGGGAVRYTIKFTADTWFEIGEFSRDGGKTWVKNFEMTLKKIG